MKKSTVLYRILLLAAAFFFGSSFAATSVAITAGLTPLMVVCFRFLTAAAIFGLLCARRLRHITRRELITGLCAGGVLCAAFILQTFGLSLTTPANNAFFVSTHVAMVPFLSWLVYRRKPQLRFFICAGLCLVGLFFLSYRSSEGFSVHGGDLLSLLCAVFFAVHLLILSTAGRGCNPYHLSFLQFGFCGILSSAIMLPVDFAQLQNVDYSSVMLPVIYLGCVCTLLGFFFQTTAQRRVPAEKSAVYFAFEPVFGALLSIASLIEPFTWQMAAGGLCVFIGAFVAQLPRSIRGSLFLRPNNPKPQKKTQAPHRHHRAV